MDAMDELIDYIMNVKARRESYEWQKARELSLALINEIRKDIGVDPTPIEYRGER